MWPICSAPKAGGARPALGLEDDHSTFSGGLGAMITTCPGLGGACPDRARHGRRILSSGMRGTHRGLPRVPGVPGAVRPGRPGVACTLPRPSSRRRTRCRRSTVSRSSASWAGGRWAWSTWPAATRPGGRSPSSSCRAAGGPARASGGSGSARPRPRRWCGIPTSSRSTRWPRRTTGSCWCWSIMPGGTLADRLVRAPGSAAWPPG